MAVGALSAHDVPLQAATRVQSRRRAVRRFKLSLLLPLMALFLFLLTPVLLLQLYFSFHQWTVYLGSWWDADFVGLDLFQEVLTDPRFGWAVVRSLAFATGSTLGCFVFGFLLAYLMYRPFRGQAVYYIIFILPMLTVPVVVAYTAEMMLYQSGPINALISAIIGVDFKPAWLTDPEHRAGDRRACWKSGIGRRSPSSFCWQAFPPFRRSRSKPPKSSARRNGGSSGKCNCRCCGR